MFAVAVLVPLGILCAAAALDFRLVEREAERRTERSADVVSEQAYRTFSLFALVLSQADNRTRSMNWPEILASRAVHDELRGLDEHTEATNGVFLVAPDGAHVATSRAFPAPAVDLTDREYFVAHRDRGTPLFVGRPQAGRVTGDRVFTVTRRRSSPDGAFDGVLGVSASIARFEARYRSLLENRGDAIALVRGDGTILVRYPAMPADAPDVLPPGHALMKAVEVSDRGSFRAKANVDGIERIFAYRKVGEYPVYAIYGLSREAIVGPWLRNLAVFAAVSLVAIALLAFAAEQTRRRARRERHALARWAEELERRETAEGALRRVQRLEALGRLTGGVAHDFNNVLQVMKSNLALLRAGRADPSMLAERMERATEQGVRLTRQLMTFARRQSLQPQRIVAADFIPPLAELLRISLRGDIALTTRVAPGTWDIAADPNELELALVNIALNARDAMPRGGAMTLDVENAPPDPRIDGKRLEGEFVAIRIADDGMGIPPDLLNKIFDPFFTTKEVGKGTGLGLSQVYGFANQSGGAVHVESEVGRGTRITIWLPRAHAALATPPGPNAPPRADAPGRPVRILLVDDNREALEATAHLLAALGSEVGTAASGAEALELLARDPGFDLMLSDVVMPGMNGHQLARIARDRHPRLAVRLVSGYSDPILPGGTDEKLLQKPLDSSALYEVLREVGARSAAAA